jgi:hypothetical protein
LHALPASSQEPAVNTEIVTIALDEPVTGLHFHNGEGVSLFRANPTGLGEPLRYQGQPRFVLRTSEAEFFAEPPLPPPHAWVDLPLGSERVLLACLKRADEPVKILAFDIGKARIEAGDYRFFNFSQFRIAVNLGNRQFAVEPGEETLVSNAAWKREVMEIDLVMAIVKDGRSRPVYSSQWGNRPGRRNYIFLFDGPQDYQPIGIRRFFDVPPAEP